MNREDTSSINNPEKSIAFTFGEPERVIGGQLSNYVHSAWNGRYYDVPINLNDLYNIYRGSVFHSSAIALKANILQSTLKPNRYIKSTDFLKYALDYLVLGNSFIERIDNSFGGLLSLKVSPAFKTRKAKGDNYVYLDDNHKLHKFGEGKVFHMLQPDIKQEVYGVPEYMASVISSQLNMESTLFRLRYYLNGSHAGYIIYLTDAAYNEGDVELLEQQLKSSKGAGNFRNLMLYAPNGKPDGLKLIPISEVAAKDEFSKIKDSSREDELGMHRVPGQLIGVVPKNTGGFGDIKSASTVFTRNEITPLQNRFLELNEWLGEEVFSFNKYEIETDEDESSPQ